MTEQYADFGPLVIETDVDQAVMQTLRLWLPTYLSQIERERELATPTLARPTNESFMTTLDDMDFPDAALPCIVVTTAETEGNLHSYGNGVYGAQWAVTVSAIVRGKTPAKTRAIAALFGGCVRRCIVQQQDLGGLAGETFLTYAGLQVVPDMTDKGRHLAAAVSRFSVYTDEVISRFGPVAGGPYPDPDPTNQPNQEYENLAAVEGVSIEVDPLDP